MLRLSFPSRVLALTAITILATAPSLRAQGLEDRPYARLELTPFGAYQWGGSFDTDAFSDIPAGELNEEGSFSWGAILSFLTGPGTAVELFYLRQDTDVKFSPDRDDPRIVGEGFANNYIQIGGRRDLTADRAFVPFISGSLGVNVLDAKGDDSGSSWRFAWTLGGGARYLLPNNPRVALRTDVRWMVTPVPSGEYGTWCSYWGCYATEGTEWLHQGSASGGVAIAF